MLEWTWIRSGVRPVPARVATPSVWAATSVAAMAVVFALNLLGQEGDTMLALIALSLLVTVLSTGARLVAAPGSALVCWLVLNGFAIPPMGRLTWSASYDLGRLACLLTAAATGTAVARLANARAAYRRLTP